MIRISTQVLIFDAEEIFYITLDLIPVLTLIFMHIITTHRNIACASTKDL